MASPRAQLASTLDKLEAAYGRLVPPADPVEAALLTLLAAHAPAFANEASRDKLRHAFVDWNEARTCDPWDVTAALESSNDAPAREFARAMLRFLESFHTALNRCTFELQPGEVKPDWAASLEKVKAAGPPQKAVMLAMLDDQHGGWHVTAEMAKTAMKLGIGGKTAAPSKVLAALTEITEPDDRLRLHYLLARYAARTKEEPDPLGAKKAAKAAKPAKARSGSKS